MARKHRSGDVEMRLVVGHNSKNPDQPPEVMPGFGDNFAPIIGHIVATWSLLEQETDVLITSLLNFHKKSVPGWQRRGFSKRWELLQDEWTLFCHADQYLTSEMEQISRHLRAGKHIRDGIAHKRTSFGLSDRGPWIRFQNENRVFPWSKRHLMEDFVKARKQITEVVGRLFRLTMRDYAQHFPLPSKSLLQQLPDTGYLRFPTR
jgi:hypothetical protein